MSEENYELYLSKTIKCLQVDHTSRCNLLCTQCARVSGDGLNPNLKMNDLNVEDYRRFFDSEKSKNVESILFCGNYGDAAASPTFLDCIEYIKNRFDMKITVMTNGSLRNEKWWKKLATLLTNKSDKVCFSIDGLSDTNHLYRRGSDFNKIIRNCQAFINVGGRARWDYIAFKHNEHQIDEAMELARQIGFSEFSIKKTSRFIGDAHYRQRQEGPLLYSDGISAPDKECYQSKSVEDHRLIVEEYGGWEKYVASASISCKSRESQTIFMDFEAKIWPCCWTASPLHFPDDNNIQKESLEKMLTSYGGDFNSLRKLSLDEVLSHKWFKRKLAESWGTKGALLTCSRTCGPVYDYSSSTKKNREIISL